MFIALNKKSLIARVYDDNAEYDENTIVTTTQHIKIINETMIAFRGVEFYVSRELRHEIFMTQNA